jgi:NAD(P)-dependent dehydrogenase (short-subunit alcohol dehydrogenase family)
MEGMDFSTSSFGIILGTGAIATSVKGKFLEKWPELQILQLGRQASGIENGDFSKEDQYQRIAEYLKSQNIKLDFIIHTLGRLGLEGKPERSIREVSGEQLLKTMEVNFGSAVYAGKYLTPFLHRDRVTLFSSLSAMVGSISDNKVGGWYGYRCSKAALNMYLKNLSLEFKLSRPKVIVNSVHPGTTLSDLSKDYLTKIKHEVLTPEACALRLISFWEGLQIKDSGQFFHANGDSLEW